MTECVDLKFRGTSGVVAAAVVRGRDGLTVIDPGPTSCLPALEAHLHDRGEALRHVRRILLTHIHLDHAGATGTIIERVPSARVYVHEIGGPHMIDPAKLIAAEAGSQSPFLIVNLIVVLFSITVRARSPCAINHEFRRGGTRGRRGTSVAPSRR